MKQKNLNGADLASISGITAATISRYLNGLRMPTVKNIMLLSNALGVSTDYLLGLHDVKDMEERLLMEPLRGNEEFILHGVSSGITISDFWSWAYSDLMNNTYRGVLAEFLIHSTFLPPHRTQMRTNWLPYDLTSPSGRRIEVKSAAYLQSWEQDYYSKILFDIEPKRAWSASTGYAPEAKRNCDLYVFCLYTALSRERSILDLDLWEFYVLATSTLNREIPNQKKISLPSLMKLQPVKTDYAGLKAAIETISL